MNTNQSGQAIEPKKVNLDLLVRILKVILLLYILNYYYIPITTLYAVVIFLVATCIFYKLFKYIFI